MSSINQSTKINHQQTKNQKSTNRNVVVIFGMHRSGTSFLAKTFANSGLNPGKDLLEANEGNLSGYFEAKDIVSFNDEILRKYDSFWNDPFVLQKLPSVEELYFQFGLKAEKILKEVYGNKDDIVLKDPRITILAKFWQKVLLSANFKVHWIGCYRDIKEVLISFHFRDKTKIETNTQCYFNYVISLMSFALENNIYICLHKDLNLNCEKIFSEIVKKFNLPYDFSLQKVDITKTHKFDLTDIKIDLSKHDKKMLEIIQSFFVKEDKNISFNKQDIIEQLKIYRDELLKKHSKYSNFILPYEDYYRHFFLATEHYKNEIKRNKPIIEILSNLKNINIEKVTKQNNYPSSSNNVFSYLDSINYFLKEIDEEKFVFYKKSLVDHDKKYEKLFQEYKDVNENIVHKSNKLVSLEIRNRDLNQKLVSLENQVKGLIPQLKFAYKLRHFLYPIVSKIPFALPIYQRVKLLLKQPRQFWFLFTRKFYPFVSKFPLIIWVWRKFKKLVRSESWDQQQKNILPYNFDKATALKAIKDICFDKTKNVEVSIIIPVYNNFIYTVECLQSIYAAGELGNVEIIIADDCSSEDNIKHLAKIKNIKVIRQQENVGFLRNINDTVAKAKGKYIVLVNNDIQVTKKWLSTLLDAIKDTKNCGIVGSKIINSDGSLQEAGARVLNDGQSEMIGYGEYAYHREYSFNREVEYVSGACMLFAKKFFKQVGKFSDELAPAYCEDVDLAFKFRKIGLKSFFVAKSVVYHRMSATYGQVSSMNKLQQCRKNQATILRKWYKEIEESNQVKTIAFYLPQFHAIKENNQWWGKGFTEWVNVKKSIPLFENHQQPKTPLIEGGLGYYDLNDVEVMNKQAKLALSYGVSGFCFYHYWFNGKKLLEMPVERLIKTGKPDIPFCICWANENWTRRWDGQDQAILIKQEYEEKDFVKNFLADLIPIITHKNYIKINGKPLVIIYRLESIKNYKNFASELRQVAKDAGVGELYLAYVEVFHWAGIRPNPKKFGFDVSIDFPPHDMNVPYEGKINNLINGFKGNILDYEKVVHKKTNDINDPFTRFFGAMPGWDNSPRRGENATIFIKNNPKLFQVWLEKIIKKTRKLNYGDERIVFINAWNEWAEGTCLEPDSQFGYQNLMAVKNALEAERLLKNV